jgi:hypothetical protein
MEKREESYTISSRFLCVFAVNGFKIKFRVSCSEFRVGAALTTKTQAKRTQSCTKNFPFSITPEFYILNSYILHSNSFAPFFASFATLR